MLDNNLYHIILDDSIGFQYNNYLEKYIKVFENMFLFKFEVITTQFFFKRNYINFFLIYYRYFFIFYNFFE